MTTMCTDPSVYELDAYWKSQGLDNEDQVRQEVLWVAASSGEVPIHTGKCRYCAELLASYARMDSVVTATDRVTMAVCPGAEAFSQYFYGEEKDEAIEQHVRTCSPCREDLAFMARSQEPREKTLPLKRRLMWLGAAAAALIFTVLPWPWNKRPDKFPAHVFPQSSQYAKLAEAPTIDRNELMAESPADRHSRLDQVLVAYDKGDYKEAERISDIIYRAVDDPSAAYLLAMSEYKQGDLKRAFESMRAAERTAPESAYRCWGTLQFALMLGDKATIQRELQHVENDAPYRARCNAIRAQLKS